MYKIIILCLISWFLFVLPQPGLSWDILEPEEFEMTDAWLTSEPQPGVDYHVLRVCQDEDMTVDCTQCIYKAKSDGAVWIPTNNRCIYRIQNDTTYSLFFQIKASSISGLQSEWTIPRIVTVDRTVENLKTESSSISLIIYNTSDSDNNTLDSDNNTSDSDSSAQPYVIVSTEEGIHEENDVDGIPDDVDYRPGSNLEQTITIDGSDSGVENSLLKTDSQ